MRGVSISIVMEESHQRDRCPPQGLVGGLFIGVVCISSRAPKSSTQAKFVQLVHLDSPSGCKVTPIALD